MTRAAGHFVVGGSSRSLAVFEPAVVLDPSRVLGEHSDETRCVFVGVAFVEKAEVRQVFSWYNSVMMILSESSVCL